MLTPKDASFAYVVLASWFVVIFVLFLIFLRAIASAFVGIFFFSREIDNEKQKARTTIAGGVDLLGEWLKAVLDITINALMYSVTVTMYFLTLILLAVTLHILYQYLPMTLGSLTVSWNSKIGQFWDKDVLTVLRVVQVVFENVVGVYNMLVFVIFKMPINLLLHMLSAGLPDLVAGGKDLAAAGDAFVTSFKLYYNVTGLECDPPRMGIVDESCYNADNRILDLVTPLRHVNKAVVHLMDFVPRKCVAAEQPVALLFYPLADAELAYTIHHAANSVLFATVQAPIVSKLRWDASKRIALAFPDFAPAFDHVVAAVIHLGRLLDNWLDVGYYLFLTLARPSEAVECDRVHGSWNVSDLNTFGVFGTNRTVLTSLTPSLFAITDGHTVVYRQHGRRSNMRVLASAWPIDINITYGIAAVAYARGVARDDNPTGPTTALFGCSCLDDLGLGLSLKCAIVPYDSFDDVTTSEFVVDVAWEIANTPRRMVCRDTKINVQSLRYVTQRLTSPSEFRFASGIATPVPCMTKGTCVTLDAAVWIMPVCPLKTGVTGQSAAGNTACMRSLQDQSCFPFCLGVRRTFSANERMVVRSSDAWENTVLLTERDCVLEVLGEMESPDTLTSETVLQEIDKQTAVVGGVTSTWVTKANNEKPDVFRVRLTNNNNDKTDATAGGATISPKCVVNDKTISTQPLEEARRMNSSMVFQQMHCNQLGAQWKHACDQAGDLYRFSPTVSMLVEMQPFVFAGDIALRTVTTCIDGSLWDEELDGSNAAVWCGTVIDVMKLTSNEHNQFQLRHIVPDGFPVTKRPATIAQTQNVLKPGMVTLPPVVVRSVYLHTPATATRDAVWYAVNHDFEPLHCLLRYCMELEDLVNCMQFSMLSSYEHMRIWKVVPYAGCGRNPVTSAPECPPHAAQSMIIDDEYAMRLVSSANFDVGEFCRKDVVQNLYVYNLEVFDSLNILVSVRRGNKQGLYNDLWGLDNVHAQAAPVAYNVFYFIHVDTLEVREGLPWVTVPVVLDGSGFLCENMRMMPSLGSAIGEAVAASVLFTKMVFNALLAIPAFIELYSDPDVRCTVAAGAHLHSAYRECGTQILDLSDMFDALSRGNVYAWEILDFVSMSVSRVVDDEAASVFSTFLSGARMYQENKVLLSKTAITANAMALSTSGAENFALGGSGSTLTSMSGVVMTMGSPAFMSGMNVGMSPVALAEYTYRLITRMIDRTIVIAKHEAKIGTKGGVQVIYILGNITLVLYDSIDTDFEDLVIMRSRRMCAGVSLMMGYTNPWGRFLRHWCLAAVEMTRGMMRSIGSFLVEIPLANCVCIRSTRHDFVPFVQGVCVPETASQLRPFLMAMLAWNGDITQTGLFRQQKVMQNVCGQTMDAFRDSLFGAFTPWAEEHKRAGLATIELLDYLGVLVGMQSGKCADFTTNPAISVVIPLPLDYFRVCGNTTVCRVKCGVYHDALEREIMLRSGYSTLPDLQFHARVESNMFERLSAPAERNMPIQLLILQELSPDHVDCRCSTKSTDCVGIVGVPYGNGGEPVDRMIIRTYCAPIGFEERVHLSLEWTLVENGMCQTAQSGAGQCSELPGLSSILDPGTPDSLVRIAYSLPFGDHVLILTREYNYASEERQESYTGSFEKITVSRSSSVVGTRLLVSSATLIDNCFEIIRNHVPSRASDLADADGKINPLQTLVSSVRIVDFIGINSTEYTVDLVVMLDVDVQFTNPNEELPSSQDTFTMFVRVGWCEYLPSNYQGVKRQTPERCQLDRLQESVFTCTMLDDAFGVTLFHDWLEQGSLMYRPPPNNTYVWVPKERVAGSKKTRGIFRVNVSLSENFIDVDLENELFWLQRTAKTNAVLGGQGYMSSDSHQGINLIASNGMMPNSPVWHWADKDAALGDDENSEKDDVRVRNEQPMWYTSASAAIVRSWLKDVRYDLVFSGLSTVSSQQSRLLVKVERRCDMYSCQGCATLRLKQLCTALQTCVSVECMGTAVNHEKLLCNAGMLLESLYSQSTGMYIALWHALVSVIISMMETQMQDNPYTFRAEWMSDLVYSVVCETKDIYATLTALVASLMGGSSDNGVSSTSMVSTSFVLPHANKVNTEAYKKHTLYISAIHQFLYQLTLYPLYWVFSVHRWTVCTVHDVVSLASDGKVRIALGERGGDVTTGSDHLAAKVPHTLGACSPQGAVEEILQATESRASLERMAALIADAFSDEDDESTKISATAAIGSKESPSKKINPRKLRPANLVIQIFDGMIAWLTGVVTGIQDVMYNSDDAECKISDISIQDSVQCACGDKRARIVTEHRELGVVGGAFWCTGVLYLPLDDGSFDYIYNPFTLADLHAQLLRNGMHEYLVCLSSTSAPVSMGSSGGSSSSGGCVQPSMNTGDYENIEAYFAAIQAFYDCSKITSSTDSTRCKAPKIQHFYNIGINPMAVLTRCRTNYVQRQWDVGAYLLFDPAFTPKVDYPMSLLSEARTQALEWAKGVSDELHSCFLTENTPGGFGTCLDVYLRVLQTSRNTTGIRSNTYFAFETMPVNAPISDDPDACILFSGPATSASENATRTMFASCMEDSDVVYDQRCTLPLVAWHGNLHARVPIGVVHRNAIQAESDRRMIANKMYQKAQADIRAAFVAYRDQERSENALNQTDALFFSAEGDVLHQMIDCMFMGPYAKVDYLVADAEGVLQTLTWYRDAEGGASRNMDLPCVGEKLHGDTKSSPFTCGSPARRAVIKSYVRDYVLKRRSASRLVSEAIEKLLAQIEANWDNIDNYPCPLGDQCGDPLRGGSGWEPNLMDFGEVNSTEVADTVLRYLRNFYVEAMTNANVWTTHFRDDVHTELWGKWKGERIAEEYQLFAPHEPIVSYSAEECMQHSEAEADTLKNSIWGVCTNLLGQSLATLPLQKYTDDDAASGVPVWMPRFIREMPLGEFDAFADDGETPSATLEWMSELMQEAWERSPLHAHYGMRYVPSMSMVCDGATVDTSTVGTFEEGDDTLQAKGSHPVLRFSRDTFLATRDASEELVQQHLLFSFNSSDRTTIPMHGFARHPLGAVKRTCPCSEQSTYRTGLASDTTNFVDAIQCVMSVSACQRFMQNFRLLADTEDGSNQNKNATGRSSVLMSVCTTPERMFSLASAPLVYAELLVYGAGMQCADMMMSDQWGLFPFDPLRRSENEKWLFATPDTYLLNHETPVVDSANLLARRPMGLTPANLLHVRNQTRTGHEFSHAIRKGPLMTKFGGRVSQPVCSSRGDDTNARNSRPGLVPETTGLFLDDDFVEALFPVAQLVYESPSLSACTRFVLEYLRLRFVRDVLAGGVNGKSLQRYEESVSRWRRRCSVKAKQTSLCRALNIFDIAPPVEQWETLLPPDCAFPIDHLQFQSVYSTQYYITPACIVYAAGAFYNAHRCRALDATLPFTPAHLRAGCALTTPAGGGNGGSDSGTTANQTNPFDLVDTEGVLDISDIAPRVVEWETLLPPDCAFPIDHLQFQSVYSTRYYITPECIVYAAGALYNAHRCRELDATLPFTPAHLRTECAVTINNRGNGGGSGTTAKQANPLDLVDAEGYNVLHWGSSGAQFSSSSPRLQQLHAQIEARKTSEAVKGTSPLEILDVRREFLHAILSNMLLSPNRARDSRRMTPPVVLGNSPPSGCGDNSGAAGGELFCEQGEFCDKVFDWWPETWTQPFGYHPTATCMAEDNAYRTFDSYMSLDRDKMQHIYEHTTLRHADKHFRWYGTAGTCRLSSVRMPLVEVNTHRVCTRQRRRIPNAALPVTMTANARLPLFATLDEEMYEEEDAAKCASHSDSVPWTMAGTGAHPSMSTVGTVHDFLRGTRPASEGGDSVSSYEGRETLAGLFPLLQMLEADATKILIPRADDLEQLVSDKTPTFPFAGVPPLNDPPSEKPWGSCVPPLEMAMCDLRRASACPPGMQCVKLPPSQPQRAASSNVNNSAGDTGNDGVCLSIPDTVEGGAIPCFSSDMCDASMHCLVEGMCGNIFFHLWNERETPLEFTVLNSQTCGIETNAEHPFTQSFAGASPWETVPDILRGHGMCAQRHQYSYRHAMRHRVVASANDDQVATLRSSTNASTSSSSSSQSSPRFYEWPWLQQTPSGFMLSNDAKQNLPDAGTPDIDKRFMHVFPHICDRTYMHAKGMKVCSGQGGELKPPMHEYELDVDPGTANGARTRIPGDLKNGVITKSYWLRTGVFAQHTQEVMDSVAISSIFATAEYIDKEGFAFLGGNVAQNDTTKAGSIGRSQARFLKCINIALCGMPVYTYNGVPVKRMVWPPDADGTPRPLSPTDVLKCGSIGFRPSNPGKDDYCILDIALFPQIRVLVSGMSPGCTVLFGGINVNGGSGSVNTEAVSVIALYSTIQPVCDALRICCVYTPTSVTGDTFCTYRALGTDTKKYMNLQTYKYLVLQLNEIISLGTLPEATYKNRVSTHVAGAVGECLEDLAEMNRVYQLWTPEYVQATGNRPALKSGIYYIFPFHLHEIPLLWYYKWVYKSVVWSKGGVPESLSMLLYSMGESWTRRASVDAGEVARCAGNLGCICTVNSDAATQSYSSGTTGDIQLRLMDRLVCLNAAVPSVGKMWVPSGDAPVVTSIQKGATNFASLTIPEMLNDYIEQVRSAIRRVAYEWVESNFDVKDTGSNAAGGGAWRNLGCFESAYWNMTRCRADNDCQTFVVQNTSSATCSANGEGCSRFNASDEEYERFFTFGDYRDGISTISLINIVNDVVDSYEFVDREFDPMTFDVKGLPMSVVPLFSLLPTPRFTDKYDSMPHDGRGNWESHPTDHMNIDQNLKTCIFVEEFTPAESSSVGESDQDTMVRFYKSTDGKTGDDYSSQLDICNNKDGEKYKVQLNAYEGKEYTKMKCSFGITQEDHGRDYCDLEYGSFDAECEGTSTAFTDYEPSVVRCHSNTSSTWKERLLEESDPEWVAHLLHKMCPNMRCETTPAFDQSECRNVVGRFNVDNLFTDFELEVATDWQTLQWPLKDVRPEIKRYIPKSPMQDFKDYYGSRLFKHTYFDGHWLKQHSVDAPYKQFGDLPRPMLMNIGYEVRYAVNERALKERWMWPFKTAHQKCPWLLGGIAPLITDEIRASNPMHSMCHSIFGPCISEPDQFRTSDGKCGLRKVVLPPGVVGKFFTTDKPQSDWVSSKLSGNKAPAWINCPDSSTRTKRMGQLWVAYNNKARPSHYNNVWNPGELLDCTAQRGGAGKWGACVNRPDDTGCYIGDSEQNAVWSIEDSDNCQGKSGACFFSLTLAEGFFCSETNEATGKPDVTCRGRYGSDSHLFRVTKPLDSRVPGIRSLWKCAPCLKFARKQYSGKFQCGARRKTAEKTSTPISSIVTELKEYISNEWHSKEKLLGLHRKYSLGFGKDANLPLYGVAGSTSDAENTDNVVFLPLQDLSFASDFSVWGASENGECPASVSERALDDSTCPWREMLDMTATKKRDDLYGADPEKAVVCAVESPGAQEYGKCNDDEREGARVLLRKWVERVYRQQQGAWLPVVGAYSAIAWQADRTATVFPFTLFFASNERNEEHRHVSFVLGTKACKYGVQEEAICARINRAQGPEKVVLVNPWMGGEFNPWLASENNNGMGLDQCLRKSGEWQICCSCFPSALCCYPDAACANTAVLTPTDVPRTTTNYFKSADHVVHCTANDFQTTPGQPLSVNDKSNVCLRQALDHIPDVCTHQQGLLGGSTGLPVETVSKLYHEEATDLEYTVEPFLIADELVLWQGALTSASLLYKGKDVRFIRLPDELLYPAHIIFTVPSSSVSSNLRVKAMQMQRNTGVGLFRSTPPVGVGTWVPQLQKQYFQEYTDLIRKLYPILDYYEPGSGGLLLSREENSKLLRPQGWECPLRMASFWGRDIPSFNPLVPDPFRSDFMFARRFYCRSTSSVSSATTPCPRGVHPYHKNVEFRGIRDFYTSDGLCFYDAKMPSLRSSSSVPNSDQQRVAHSADKHPCGLLQQVSRVLQGSWGLSRVMTSVDMDCPEVLDWPSQPLEYRNGESPPTTRTSTNQGQGEEGQSCRLLGRIPPFALKLMSDAPLYVHPTETTSDEGGDCHMGRATRVSEEERTSMGQYELCVTMARTSTQASVRCSGLMHIRETPANGRNVTNTRPTSRAERAQAPDRVFVLQREMRKRPLEDIATGVSSSGNRAQCSACDVDRVKTQGPGESLLTLPETSVGTIHRMSAERLLANDVRRACLQIPECKIRSENWKAKDFLYLLLNDPAQLITKVDYTTSGTDTGSSSSGGSSRNGGMKRMTMLEDIENVTDVIPDDELWTVPWVLSIDGKNNTIGTIDKAQWKTNRFATCWAQIGQLIANDTTGTFVRPISIADITGPLQDLTTKLRNVKQDIINANCIASGDDCEILGTYYSPAQWSPSNKAFARETVRDFYKFHAADACAGEVDRVKQAEEENAQVQPKCAASSMESVKKILQLSRLTVRLVMAGFMHISMIMVDFYMLILSKVSSTGASNGLSFETFVQDMVHHVMQLLDLWMAAMQQVMDLFIEILSEISPVGKVFAKIFHILCQIVTMIYEVVFKGFVCNFVKGLAYGVVWLINAIIYKLKSFFGNAIKTGGWDKFKIGFDDFILSLPCSNVKSGWNDVVSGKLGCSMPPTVQSVAITHAFLATRCWANPSFADLQGTGNALGCAPSDTCWMDGPGSKEDVCERCPSVDVANFARFGCSVYHKRCMCAVPLLSTVQCMRNADCRQRVPCTLLADAESFSYGMVDCYEGCATEPMCLVQDGGSSRSSVAPVGECVCMLNAPRVQACEGQGKLVAMGIDDGLCMFARDTSLANTITIDTRNVLQMGALAVAPCPLLSRSNTHLTCQQVQTTSGALRNVVVGTAFLRLPASIAYRRRLMWESASASTSLSWEELVPVLLEDKSVQWDGADDCTEIVSAYRESIGSDVGATPQLLGVLDKLRLRQCLKWRAVANVTIAMFNISSANDKSLLSWGNFIDFLSQEAGLLLYTPKNSIMMRPIAYAQAAFYVFSQLENAERLADFFRRMIIIANRVWMQSTLSDESRRFRAQMESLSSTVRQKGKSSNTTIPHTNFTKPQQCETGGAECRMQQANITEWIYDMVVVGLSPSDFVPPSPHPQHHHSRRLHQHPVVRRGLLQDDTLSERWKTLQWDWSLDITRMQAKWSGTQPVCELYDIAYDSVTTMWDATSTYYSKGYAPRNSTKFGVMDNLMKTPTCSMEKETERESFIKSSRTGTDENNMLDYLIESVIAGINYFTGVNKTFVVSLFDPDMPLDQQIAEDVFSFQRLLNDLARCNVPQLMMCSTKPRALIPTVAIVFVLIWILCKLAALSSGFTITIELLVLPWMVMWYAYGFSPTCFPMIPTCFMADLILALESTFPSRIEWPALLIHQDICTREGVPYANVSATNINCFKSCASDEFGFRGWQDPFAWFLCEIHTDTCLKAASWLVTQSTMLFQQYNETTAYFVKVLEFDNHHVTEAHRTCAVFTGFYVIPALCFGVWLVLMTVTLLRALVTLTFKTLLYVWNAPGLDVPYEEDEGVSGNNEDTQENKPSDGDSGADRSDPNEEVERD